MSNKPENPAEPFKKALGEATRAMANEPELTVTYSVDPPGVSNDTLRLPQVSQYALKLEPMPMPTKSHTRMPSIT